MGVDWVITRPISILANGLTLAEHTRGNEFSGVRGGPGR